MTALSNNARWHDAPKGAVHTQVAAHATMLEGRERMRIWRDAVNERIYCSNVGQTMPRTAEAAALVQMAGFSSTDLNFTRQIVDALVARIGNNSPGIKVAADGATWSLRRQAKIIDKLIEGESDALDIDAKAPLGLRDCLMSRAGVMKVVPDAGRIVADLIPVEEILVDTREARYGQPRQLIHTKQVAKEVLLKKFAHGSGEGDQRGKAAAIKSAPPAKPRLGEQTNGMDTNDSPMVDVREAWHLPSAPGAKDGRHVICIEGATLLDEPWERDSFPFAFIRWSPPRKNFWGPVLVDELAALQYKINEIFRDLQQNIYFTSALKILTRRGSDTAKKHLAGKRPHTVEVDNPGDVQWVAPDGFSLAQFQFLQWLIQQMFEVSGVSQLMAQSKNPLGAGASGAALDSFYDIESERFSQLELAYARFRRDIGSLIVEAARDLADDEDFKEREVRWVKRSIMSRLKWSDVDLDQDRFELRLEAVGFLPNTRAGKMKAIEALLQAGLIPPDEALSLLDFPDTRRANNLTNASREVVERALEQVADCDVDKNGQVTGDPPEMPAPDQHWNLKLAMKMSKAAYQEAVTEDCPEGIKQRFIAWLDQLDAAMTKASQQPAGPAQPGMDPMAMGGAPPMDPMMAAPVDPMAPPMPGNGAAPMPPGVM